jgi:hypothetical protein
MNPNLKNIFFLSSRNDYIYLKIIPSVWSEFTKPHSLSYRIVSLNWYCKIFRSFFGVLLTSVSTTAVLIYIPVSYQIYGSQTLRTCLLFFYNYFFQLVDPGTNPSFGLILFAPKPFRTVSIVIFLYFLTLLPLNFFSVWMQILIRN